MAARPTTRAIALASILVTVAVLVSGCGGAKSRLARHIKRGQDYFQSGNFSKAGIEFSNAMQIDPKDLTARLMAGETAARLGQLPNAYGLLQSVVNDHPDNIEARTALSRLLLTARDPKRALDIIKPALDKQPDNAALLVLRSAGRSALKDSAGSRADANRALALDPRNEDAIDLRAGLYQQDGDLPAAIELVSKAAAAQPNVPSFHEVLLSLYQATSQPVRAEEQLRLLVRLKPDELGYRTQLAIFLTRSKRLDEAQQVLTDAVKALPSSDDAKLLRIEFLVQQRSPAVAEQALLEYVDADPRNYSMRLALGGLQQRLNELDKAIATYGETVRRAGTEPAGLAARDRLASIAIARKREPEAQTYLAEVLKVNPRDSDALTERGRLSLEHGDSASAIGDFRAVLRDHPSDMTINRLLGQALINHGDTALAEEPLRAAVDAAPTDSTLRVALAQLLSQLQRPDRGIELLQQGIKAAPGDDVLNQALIRAYLAQKNFSAAAIAADSYRHAKPADAAPYLAAGLVARADNRLDDAQKLLESALAIQPHAYDVLSDLVQVQVQRGQGAQAVTRLQGLMAANSKGNAGLLLPNLLCEVYLQQKNFKAAQQAAVQAIASQPKWWPPYHNLALAKSGTDDLAGATEALQNGLKAIPWQPELLSDLGALYQRTGNVDDAVRLYESWVSRDPTSQLAANNLAMLLVSYRTDSASLDRARALTANFGTTSNGDLLDTAGWVQFKRGEYNQALPALQRALELLPSSQEVHYHLGMAELRTGQTDRARTDLEAALAGSGQFIGSDDARATLATLKNRAG
jgi:tetratricopeptide (TPR) repeat protein